MTQLKSSPSPSCSLLTPSWSVLAFRMGLSHHSTSGMISRGRILMLSTTGTTLSALREGERETLSSSSPSRSRSGPSSPSSCFGNNVGSFMAGPSPPSGMRLGLNSSSPSPCSFLSAALSSFARACFSACSFCRSMPSALASARFSICCSRFTYVPSSTKWKPRRAFFPPLTFGSKKGFFLGSTTLLSGLTRAKGFFLMRSSFSLLMFTLRVDLSCGLMGTTLPSSSTSLPNSSTRSGRIAPCAPMARCIPACN
mmetsp:Transcript_25757/g.63887  ORF Transcript_25757/g.63887 Transcript_25757/m.63887 type:complete len:254 (-) Transcript_25757:595-1356(-)